MYKPMFMGVVLAFSLSGCQSHPDTNWTSDCEKYHSYDTRELGQCESRKAKDKVAEEATDALIPDSGKVVVDPDSTKITPQKDIGKH